MTRPLRVARFTVAAALSAVVILAGCTGGTTTITPTNKSSTPTASPTASSVDAPRTTDEAWAAANRTIGQFVQVQYEIEKDGGATPERIEPFASGEALASTRKIASDLASQRLRITGAAPDWEPNASASSFGDLTTAAGQRIANGAVHILGCWDLSKQSTVAPPGSTPPKDRSMKRFPLQFDLVYFPDLKTWMVTKQTNIAGEPGAPQC